MITGSHNPKNYNDIKLIINDKPVSGTEIYNLIISSKSSKTKRKITLKISKMNIFQKLKKILL